MNYEVDRWIDHYEAAKELTQKYKERIRGNSFFALHLYQLVCARQTASLNKIIDNAIDPIREAVAIARRSCSNCQGRGYYRNTDFVPKPNMPWSYYENASLSCTNPLCLRVRLVWDWVTRGKAVDDWEKLGLSPDIVRQEIVEQTVEQVAMDSLPEQENE